MSTLVFAVWELQLSAPKEEDVVSLVSCSSQWQKGKACLLATKQRLFIPPLQPFPQSLLAKSQERLIMMLYVPRMNQEKALLHDHEFNILFPWKAYDYMSNIVIVKVMK